MVGIKVIGQPNTAEHEAGEALKAIFEAWLRPHQKGCILIASGFTCFGERTKDIDLVVVGQFENGIPCDVNLDGNRRKVYFHNFAFTIEVKDHPPEDIRFEGFRAEVRYRGAWSDATEQSKNQRVALVNFLWGTVRWRPFTCSFIWFRNLRLDDLETCLRTLVAPANHANLHKQHNWLPAEFDVPFLFHLACVQKRPNLHQHNDASSALRFYSTKNQSPQEVDRKITEAHSVFTEIQQGLGKLTRERLEKITKEAILKDQQYVQAIGNRLVVVRGWAGTGKTIKLIHIAYGLCRKRGERCLILTYNKALVSDIRRTIALAKAKSDLDDGAVQVETIHAFMRRLLVGFGLYTEQDTRPYLDHYEELKAEFLALLREKAVTAEDIQSLLREHQDEVAWDKLLIDEGQDWPQDEREILFAVFDSKNFIVADGVDQLVRGQVRTNWTKGVEYHKPIIGEKRSLRQKANLCRFENQFAVAAGLDWEIEPKNDFVGGRVIITTRGYDPELHGRLSVANEQDGNRPYEMLFVVPPSLVAKKAREPIGFKLADEWGKWGISLWDGTVSDTRTEYPREIKQHRVLQYDSCRGLEGWVVICLWLDDLVSHKRWVFDNTEQPPSEDLFDEETSTTFAYRWSMIPMTRAVDTLVITLRDGQSDLAKVLRKLYENNTAFVEWID
jgi:AAA domain